MTFYEYVSRGLCSSFRTTVKYLVSPNTMTSIDQQDIMSGPLSPPKLSKLMYDCSPMPPNDFNYLTQPHPIRLVLTYSSLSFCT